jgi:hypothetical protein
MKKAECIFIYKHPMVAKFWLEPVALADSHNISPRTLRELERLVEENADEFRTAWQKHLGQ